MEAILSKAREGTCSNDMLYSAENLCMVQTSRTRRRMVASECTPFKMQACLQSCLQSCSCDNLLQSLTAQKEKSNYICTHDLRKCGCMFSSRVPALKHVSSASVIRRRSKCIAHNAPFGGRLTSSINTMNCLPRIRLCGWNSKETLTMRLRRSTTLMGVVQTENSNFFYIT